MADKQTLEQRIESAILRRPHASNLAIAKNIFGNCRVSDVQRVRDTMSGKLPEEPVAPAALGGIPLGRLRVTAQRPAETAALRIQRLPPGQGFEPKTLAAEWGGSEDNIRKHAKDMKCLKYAEIAPGQWVQLVMSPETAAKYP